MSECTCNMARRELAQRVQNDTANSLPRILQDVCANKGRQDCPDDGVNPPCSWSSGNCVPLAAPATDPVSLHMHLP